MPTRTRAWHAIHTCQYSIDGPLAAIVMAARQGELDPNTRLSSEDPALAAVLINHVKTVFAEYDGKVGMDD